MPASGLAEALEEPLGRRKAAVQRLDDDAGQLVGVRRDEALGRGQVVIGRDQHVLLVDAGGRRLGRRERPQLLGKQARHPHIVRAVVGPFKFQDLLPAGKRPRQSQDVHCSLGAGRAEANLVAGRTQPHQLLPQRQRRLGDEGEVRPPRSLPDNGLDHLRPGMPDQRRAPAHRKVVKMPALGVPQRTPLPPVNHNPHPVGDVEFAVGAGRKYAERAVGVAHKSGHVCSVL